MKKIYLYAFFSLTCLGNVFSQVLDDSTAKSFINAIINDSKEIVNYVYEEELILSNRLEINYIGKRNKFLISNEIEDTVKLKLRNKSCGFDYFIKPLGNQYSQLTIKVPSINKKFEYYFYKTKLISKPYYFSRNWKTFESKFFVFHSSNLSYTNQYAVNMLDEFVQNMCNILEIDNSNIENLKKSKIHYFLCKDENEIELLTDYKARGLYFLPYDYIISTYNNHYHEILHLLMNFKLKQVNLYTLPILQEGFAVAFGGRGGKSSDVILNMGLFLENSDFLNYDAILSKLDFYQMDASLAYPVSGLYTKFLIENFGIERFIKLYKQYSADISGIDNLKINIADLPEKIEWKTYLKKEEQKKIIKISNFDERNFSNIIFENNNLKVYENDLEYLIKLKEQFFIETNEKFDNYESNLFKELFPTKTYECEKYLISANDEEISVYNFFTNTLIAKYVQNFSLNIEPIKKDGEFFIFTLDKILFDHPIKKENIKNGN